MGTISMGSMLMLLGMLGALVTKGSCSMQSLQYEVETLRGELAVIRTAFQKLIRAVAVASGDEEDLNSDGRQTMQRGAVDEPATDEIVLDGISLNYLAVLLRGEEGQKGERGANGAPGQPGDNAEVGVVYTRWGRKTCGTSSTQLYEGFAASAYHRDVGGGTNYQCLPLDPQWDQYTNNGGHYSYISGAEYQTQGYPSTIPSSANNQNVPCSRCHSTRSAVLMIPARKDCPVGWTTEYNGYLMSAYHNHAHPTTYECIDERPEYVTGQASDTEGALFYFVKAVCRRTGTVGHCPPYSESKSLLCVVCTK